jgi:hypothetical protein
MFSSKLLRILLLRILIVRVVLIIIGMKILDKETHPVKNTPIVVAY